MVSIGTDRPSRDLHSSSALASLRSLVIWEMKSCAKDGV